MTSIVEKMPNLTKHFRVLTISWQLEKEAEQSRKRAADPEFLPAALEIIESPPSPGLRILMWTLCSLFALAILWSCFGRLDVVAVATGKIIPVANVKVIQPLEIGVVRAIRVRNGQHVRKGQLLIELDPTMVGAEEAQARRGLNDARVTQARNTALLAFASGKGGGFVAPEGTPEDTAAVERQMFSAATAEYRAKRTSLIEARAQSAADLAGAEAEIAKLEQTLPLVDEQIAARRELVSHGHYSRLRLLEYEQARIEHIRNIDVQKSSAAKARAAIANLDSQIAELKGTFQKDAVGQLSDAGSDASLRQEELRKSMQRKAFQTMRSPVDGTVQQLVIHTVGGVVQPAQPLMVIVPDGTNLEVEAQIENKDIGFVRAGQPVRIKLEAFPFTDYGLIPGTVVDVSRDAVQDEKRGLLYTTRVRLDCRSGFGARVIERKPVNLCAQIGPGMEVQAEIRTGSRRIIQYLLSPISKAVDEAGRER